MNNQNGLTLLEVLIAMFILGVGILGLCPLFILSIDGNSISKDVISASSLSKERIEIYEGMDSLPATPYKNVENDIDGIYDVTTTIIGHATDSTIPDGYYKIDVYVDWNDKIGRSRSSTYSTLLND